MLGLAPSATAAAELAHAVGAPAETVAKWRHASANGDEATAARWALRAGQLVIVDEAAMVTTPDLDALLTHASAAGAKIVLAGDHHQLGAVGAGGAFALLADTVHAVHLDALWRFTHRWEAHTTRALRQGDPAALDAYAAHGRLHDGPAELMLDAAYTAWATDRANGHTAVLLAPDRHTVASLNTRARTDRIATGHVEAAGVPIAEDAVAGRGDIIVTRRNNRRLRLDDGRYVRNGDLWSVTVVHPDGALDAVAVPRPGSEQPSATTPVRLPADYVREHVELGYAATIHRAQGMTVDRAHVLAGPGMTRQGFYVAMTRGRDANHTYVALDAPDRSCPDSGMPPEPTGRQILEQILATDGGEISATATLRQRQNEATAPARLRAIRDTLTTAPDAASASTVAEIDDVLRYRVALRRPALPADRAASSRAALPAPPNRPDGITR